MTRKKTTLVKGQFSHRRTEADYMGVLLDAVPLEDWRAVVTATVAAARAGDAAARAWLAQYLVGKPGATAPGPTDRGGAAALGARSVGGQVGGPAHRPGAIPGNLRRRRCHRGTEGQCGGRIAHAGSPAAETAEIGRKRRRDGGVGAIIGPLSMFV